MAKSAPAAAPRRLFAFLFLSAAVLLLFHPVVLGEGLLYFRDVSLNHFPNRVYATARLLAGDFPLWNPYLSGGLPLAANPNQLILHPVTLLFLALPVSTAFTASVVLQFLLAAWGMFRWAREEGLGQEASLFAGVSFALSGPLVSCGSLHNLLGSWAWVPLALFAMARFRRTGSRPALLLHALALSVPLLAGDPVAAASAVVIGALAGMPGGDTPRTPARRLLASLGGAALALGIALVSLLPARQVVAASERGAGIPYERALAWSLEPVRLLETVVPSLYGDPTALRPTSYWGGLVFEKGYPFLLSVYLGILTVLLLPAAGWRKAGMRAALLGGFSALCVLIALGGQGGIYPLLYRWVPLVSSLRYPSRFMLPATLALAFLAALGLQRALEGWERAADRPARCRLWIHVALASAAAAFAMALIPGAIPGLLEGALGVGKSMTPDALERIAATLRVGFLRSGILAAGAGATGWCASRGFLAPRRAAGLLVLAATADLLAAHRGINPVVPATFYEARPPAADLVERGRLVARVYTEARPEGFAVMAGSDDAWWGYYWDEVTCRVATCLPWKIPTALDRSTDLLSPAPLGVVAEELAGADALRLKRVCDVASVGVIQTYRELQDAGLVQAGILTRQTNVPFRLYRSLDPLPRAYGVSAAVPERDGIVEDLTRPGWDPRASVILEGLAADAGTAGAAWSVEWLVDEPERLELRVRAPEKGWLVVTDSHYPGWKAEVDGSAAPILRANRLFRAVQVPGGSHHVVLRYAPGVWRIGAGGSLLTLLAATAWGLWRVRGRRG